LNEYVPSIARYTLFRRVFATTTLALVAATWRLWAIESDYPCVPLIQFGVSAPAWLDWVLRLCLVSLLVALFVISGRSPWERPLSLATAVVLIGCFMLNQHRMQPWAYLAAIGCFTFTCQDPGRTFRLWRLLCVSIYVYSAISKADVAFINGMGHRFLETGLSFLGIDPSDLPRNLNVVAIAAMPLCELLIGIGLILRHGKRWALPLCMALHSSLILILSPMGLNHRPGVLIWNAALMVEVLLLFTGHEQPEDLTVIGSGRSARARLAECVAFIAVACPLLEPTGWFDHWPAWNLYSEQTDKVEILVRTDRLTRFPWELRRLSVPSRKDPKWSKAYIEEWSLQTLLAPIYPEDRFQVGVALALAERYRLDEAIMVRIHSPPNRISGQRSSHVIVGAQGLRKEAESFILNAIPRSLPPQQNASPGGPNDSTFGRSTAR
jgi:hypothetical protein